jgi:chromosome segregation ATPase
MEEAENNHIYESCVMRNRVEDMQDVIYGLNTRLMEVDKKASVSQEILERLESSNNKLVEGIVNFSNVMQKFEVTIVNMQNEIKNGSIITNEVKDRVEHIESRMNGDDDKVKIDLRDILKSKAIWIVSGGAFISICGLIIGLINIIISNHDMISRVVKAIFN